MQNCQFVVRLLAIFELVLASASSNSSLLDVLSKKWHEQNLREQLRSSQLPIVSQGQLSEINVQSYRFFLDTGIHTKRSNT